MYAAQGNASGAPDPIAPLSLAVAGSLFITRPLLNHYLLTREELAWRAAEVFGWAAAGELRWELERVFPLEQVIPTPSHLLDRISPIFPPFFSSFFVRFHRLAETVPTSRKPDPRAKKQPARVPKQPETPFLRSS